jgi:hypothetical protein
LNERRVGWQSPRRAAATTGSPGEVLREEFGLVAYGETREEAC